MRRSEPCQVLTHITLICVCVLATMFGASSAQAASCSITPSKTTIKSGESITFTVTAVGYKGKAVRLYRSATTTPWSHLKTFTTNATSSFSAKYTVTNVTSTHSYRVAVAEPTNSGNILCAKKVMVTVTNPPQPSTVCVPVVLSSSSATAIGLDPWYQKYCYENGLLIAGTNETPDTALVEAGRIMRSMLGVRSDVWEVLRIKNMKMAIVADTEKILDIPEYRMLPVMFPNMDYSYPRGLGATNYIPVTSSSEENLLCYGNDPYREESVTVHEFAHSIMNMGLSTVDPTFMDQLEVAYQDAKATGKWANTFAATNIDEYWAEGVQSYFDTNAERNPTDGIHNYVDTRDELATYDPALFAVVNQAFAGNTWKYQCPTSTATTTAAR